MFCTRKVPLLDYYKGEKVPHSVLCIRQQNMCEPLKKQEEETKRYPHDAYIHIRNERFVSWRHVLFPFTSIPTYRMGSRSPGPVFWQTFDKLVMLDYFCRSRSSYAFLRQYNTYPIDSSLAFCFCLHLKAKIIVEIHCLSLSHRDRTLRRGSEQ